jgi:3-hydroxyisobutyrate dehydrogenase-like beta-hydroxyacid dehydrogenase
MTSEGIPPFPTHFGWVGLGAMGFPMAEQLRRKLPQTCTLWVYDINLVASETFVRQETQYDAGRDCQGAQVNIATSSRDVAEKSVRMSKYLKSLLTLIPGIHHYYCS